MKKRRKHLNESCRSLKPRKRKGSESTHYITNGIIVAMVIYWGMCKASQDCLGGWWSCVTPYENTIVMCASVCVGVCVCVCVYSLIECTRQLVKFHAKAIR